MEGFKEERKRMGDIKGRGKKECRGGKDRKKAVEYLKGKRKEGGGVI